MFTWFVKCFSIWNCPTINGCDYLQHLTFSKDLWFQNADIINEWWKEQQREIEKKNFPSCQGPKIFRKIHSFESIKKAE